MYRIMRQTVFILALCAVLYANDVLSVKFDRLTTETGLASNAVECIYQDHQGYMWFGTQDGLTRYDGYSFINYKHDPTIAVRFQRISYTMFLMTAIIYG